MSPSWALAQDNVVRVSVDIGTCVGTRPGSSPGYTTNDTYNYNSLLGAGSSAGRAKG